MTARVCLFHWNEHEAASRAKDLRSLGYKVDVHAEFGPGLLRTLAERPPDAVVIDLSRLPSHGRDVAIALRTRAGTRRVPLVVAGGSAEAVGRLREHLPDAVYASWESVERSLAKAIVSPPSQSVVPGSALAGYSGTPLPKKLGIKEGSIVSLFGAPDGFEGTLGELPADARLRRGRPAGADLVLWFVRSTRELERGLPRHSQYDVPLWIVSPKKTSGVDTDINQNVVRERGLSVGLVDYKVCAVDETWSGLLFRRRQ
jgi:CheY-like chemotaxis protein